MREGGEQGAKISGIEEEKGLEIEIKIKLKKEKCKQSGQGLQGLWDKGPECFYWQRFGEDGS